MYNKKANLVGDSFLQIAFGEWFSGKKENIAKNYSVLPKHSLVSKDGVETDLVNLRKLISKKEDCEDGPPCFLYPRRCRSKDGTYRRRSI